MHLYRHRQQRQNVRIFNQTLLRTSLHGILSTHTNSGGRFVPQTPAADGGGCGDTTRDPPLPNGTISPNCKPQLNWTPAQNLPTAKVNRRRSVWIVQASKLTVIIVFHLKHRIFIRCQRVVPTALFICRSAQTVLRAW